MSELEMLVYDFGLDDKVLPETRKLLTRAIDDQMNFGRKNSCVAIGCLYLACRLVGEYVPLNRVLKVPLGHGVSNSELRSIVRTLILRLGISASKISLRPEQYLSGILRLLRVDHELDELSNQAGLEEAATQLLRGSLAKSFGGNPAILAAASLYLGSVGLGHRLKQQTLAEAAGSSELGLRNCIKRLSSKAHSQEEPQRRVRY
jgi:transcription initiation factor TFIIIB Brf1 subunit/transcription initiation factor TFIIB